MSKSNILVNNISSFVITKLQASDNTQNLQIHRLGYLLPREHNSEINLKKLILAIRNDFASQFYFEVIENDSFENMIEIVNKS